MRGQGNISRTKPPCFLALVLLATGACSVDVGKLRTPGVKGPDAGPDLAKPADGPEDTAADVGPDVADAKDLLASPDVTGTYTNVPGAASPWPITPLTEPSLFFRVRQP